MIVTVAPIDNADAVKFGAGIKRGFITDSDFPYIGPVVFYCNDKTIAIADITSNKPAGQLTQKERAEIMDDTTTGTAYFVENYKPTIEMPIVANCFCLRDLTPDYLEPYPRNLLIDDKDWNLIKNEILRKK